jgi:PAS domain S-box-containing protein
MSAIVDVETLNANRQKADSDTIRQLQESNEHLQLFAESIGAGFWSRTGEDTSTITWSDEVWSLLGYDEPEPYRYGLFREHLVGEDRQRYADALNRMHEQQVPLDIEVCARLKNGCRRWLRVTAKIVHDSSGRLDKVIGAVQDIDKLHRLQDLNAQLTTTTKALQHQSQQTSASNNELRALAYASSHDLRTPMNSLSLILQVISEEIEEGNYEYVRQLARDGLEITRQGSDLVEDVLDYLRVADTSMPEESLDLSQLTQSVLEQLSAAEPAVMDVTTVTVKGPLPQVQGCRIQIRLLIYNLISNAVKFRRSDYTHSVIVEAVAEDGYEGVAVTDNGIGIAEHKQAEVFDMFKRLNRKSDYPGSGLGLALCQRIALNHRARLLLRSEPGCGSTFTIWFPVESV